MRRAAVQTTALLGTEQDLVELEEGMVGPLGG
jgi:hypothetical protein